MGKCSGPVWRVSSKIKLDAVRDGRFSVHPNLTRRVIRPVAPLSPGDWVPGVVPRVSFTGKCIVIRNQITMKAGKSWSRHLDVDHSLLSSTLILIKGRYRHRHRRRRPRILHPRTGSIFDSHISVVKLRGARQLCYAPRPQCLAHQDEWRLSRRSCSTPRERALRRCRSSTRRSSDSPQDCFLGECGCLQEEMRCRVWDHADLRWTKVCYCRSTRRMLCLWHR